MMNRPSRPPSTLQVIFQPRFKVAPFGGRVSIAVDAATAPKGARV